MDIHGFREYLQERKISEQEITASIHLAKRFEDFVGESEDVGEKDLLDFSTSLIETEENTISNYYALARYAYFIGNHEVYIATVDLLDGAEAMDNFYQKVS